jgi:hypothetical protein
MKTKITLHFYARSTKANSNGLLPIYGRLTIDGKRLEFSTKKFVEKTKWSIDLSKMKGNSEEARSINSYLDLMKSKVFDVQMQLLYQNEALSIENFKKKLLGNKERQRMLVPIFQDHNNKIKELIGKEYAPGTLERYVTSLKHTIEFMQWKYNVSDIEITKIDHAFVIDSQLSESFRIKMPENTLI